MPLDGALRARVPSGDRRAAPGAVYREAPVAVDLVPLRDRAPRAGVRVEDKKLALDVSIGNAWGTNWALDRSSTYLGAGAPRTTRSWFRTP